MARSDLLRAVIYPDSDDVENPLGNGTDTVYDRVEYKYNRLGQTVEMKDQAGTVHAFDDDKLGRPTQDRVTAFGSGVDQTAKRIGRTYEVRGMLEKVTSYDHATVGQGNIVNEVQHAYNSFGQLVTEYQEHAGAVNTGSSLKTQYGHADGGSSSNHIRPTSLGSPASRWVIYDYGSSGEMDDVLNRVRNLRPHWKTIYATYTYLGMGTIVRTDLPVPEVRLDLWGGTSGTYAGIDRFGRTISHGWVYYNGGSTDRDRFDYGYDRASNRLFKDNTVTTLRDEYYTYDNLHRLANMDRGTLNGGKTAISGTPARQEQYTLDPTGNWVTYLTRTSGTTDLDHDRDHNEANEVGTITTNTGSAWISPVHDPAGNMTQVPKPGNETTRLHLVYDAWNRLAAAKNDNGGSPGTTIATYTYDAKGRRIGKAINGGDTFDYYYNASYQLLEVRRNADTDPLEHYVWDISYIDAPLIWFRDSNVDGTVDDTMYVARDANFNVTALIDTSGTVQERYFYDPYGRRTVLDGSWGARGSSSYDWTLGHQGLTLDGETGLYYNRARMLHATLGRFVQRDPMGYVDGGGLYESRRSNTVAHFDSTGYSGSPWPVKWCSGCQRMMPLDHEHQYSPKPKKATAADLTVNATDGWEPWGPYEVAHCVKVNQELQASSTKTIGISSGVVIEAGYEAEAGLPGVVSGKVTGSVGISVTAQYGRSEEETWTVNVEMSGPDEKDKVNCYCVWFWKKSFTVRLANAVIGAGGVYDQKKGTVTRLMQTVHKDQACDPCPAVPPGR